MKIGYFLVIGVPVLFSMVGCTSETAFEDPALSATARAGDPDSQEADPDVEVAKRGGVKVDANGGCSDPDREDNVLSPSNIATLWYTCPGCGASVTRYYTIDCKTGADLTTCTSIFLPRCPAPDDEFYGNDFTTTSATDTRCTLRLFDDSSCTAGSSGNDLIGADSWLQSPSPG